MERRSIQRPNLLLVRYLASVMLGRPLVDGLKCLVSSCHMSLPLRPSLHTRFGTPLTVTFTLVMSGLKNCSVSRAPGVKGLMKRSSMPLSDRRWGFTRRLRWVSEPRVMGTTLSRMTRSYANSLPLLYVLITASARSLLLITSYSSWMFSSLYPSLV